MSKAYDRVDWSFLIRVLSRFGFSQTWINLIYRIISNCWYSISINRKTGGFFRSFRGLKQGNPISPALFIIAHDALSRKISKLCLHGHLKLCTRRRNNLPISHLFYADDSLIFINGGKSNIDLLLATLRDYASTSGQVINFDKSSLIVSNKMHMSSHAENIACSSGLKLTYLPIQYLGVPIFKGRAKLEYFYELMTKFDKRISGWRGRLLSFGGKITLLKSVLNALPVHALSVIKPPNKLIQHLEKSMAAFLWNSKERHRKRWISWTQVCRPMDEGGLGIRALK